MTPAPEAAYALLKSDPELARVVVSRFAWSPTPERIELVETRTILLREVVRRRAIYKWRSSVRKNSEFGVAVQKNSFHRFQLTSPVAELTKMLSEKTN